MFTQARRVSFVQHVNSLFFNDLVTPDRQFHALLVLTRLAGSGTVGNRMSIPLTLPEVCSIAFVSLAMALAVAAVTDHSCIRVRDGFLLCVLVFQLAFAFGLPLAHVYNADVVSVAPDNDPRP